MEKVFDLKKINPLTKAYTKFIRNRITDKNITSSYLPYIDALSKHKFRSQQELTDFLGCNKAHTSRTLLAMKLKGIIKPTYSQNVIELTEKGKNYVEQLQKAQKEFVVLLSEGITNEEKVIFEKVLDRFLTNTNKMEGV